LASPFAAAEVVVTRRREIVVVVADYVLAADLGLLAVALELSAQELVSELGAQLPGYRHDLRYCYSV